MADDADYLQPIYAPSVSLSATSFELLVPTVPEMRRRILDTLENLPFLVCTDDDRVLGYAYASQFRPREAYRWSVECSAYVGESDRGRGIGKALYRALFDILVRQGYYNAFAGITLPNTASVKLHEAMGFIPIGVYKNVGYKMGSWHDVGWWQRSLRTHEPDPREPVRLADFLAASPLDIVELCSKAIKVDPK